MTYALAHVNGLLHTFQRPDSASHWKILPQTSPSAGKNLHSLEQSGPKPASHRPDSSTRWKNLPAERSAGVRILQRWKDPPAEGPTRGQNPPVIGTKRTLKQYNRLKTSSHWMNSPTSASSEPLFLHPMEEFSRKPAIHSPNTSTQWRNLDSERHPNT